VSGSGSESHGDGDKRVVVGVDGSDCSLNALRWAARDAELTGSVLEVITAWTFPEHAAPLGVIVRLPWPEDLMAQAREALDALIERELPGCDRARVHAQVIRGSAAAVLLEASRDADLLVVGNRGRGAFADLLLGSVGEHCVRHALCPVVVVR
jgi:nucleotide-binding universal stress UspA family protein